MERKFTDNEIVKALECCREKDCCDCPMSEYPQTICEWDAFDIAIDLINRQKAENSNLTSDLNSLQNDLTSAKAEIERLNGIRAKLSKENDALKEEKDNLIKTYKECMTEAIKEFAERLEHELKRNKDDGFGYVVYLCDIRNLAKEMTGENNGN